MTQLKPANPFAPQFSIVPKQNPKAQVVPGKEKDEEDPIQRLKRKMAEMASAMIDQVNAETTKVPLARQPGPNGLTPLDEALKWIREAAQYEDRPNEFHMEAAKADAAARAFQQSLDEQYTPLPNVPELPVPVKPPEVRIPPEYTPPERNNIVNYMSAVLGLFKPQRAGAFQAAGIEGLVQKQIQDFERKRQYWQDVTTTDQNAYQNSVSHYNQLVQTRQQDYLNRLNRASQQRQFEELQSQRRLSASEKQYLAESLKSMGDNYAKAQVAQQRAEGAKAAVELMNKTEQQSDSVRLLGSILSTMPALLASEWRTHQQQIQSEKLALQKQFMPYRIAEILNRMDTRTLNLRLKEQQFELAKREFALASELGDLDKVKLMLNKPVGFVSPNILMEIKKAQSLQAEYEDIRAKLIEADVNGIVGQQIVELKNREKILQPLVERTWQRALEMFVKELQQKYPASQKVQKPPEKKAQLPQLPPYNPMDMPSNTFSLPGLFGSGSNTEENTSPFIMQWMNRRNSSPFRR